MCYQYHTVHRHVCNVLTGATASTAWLNGIIISHSGQAEKGQMGGQTKDAEPGQ